MNGLRLLAVPAGGICQQRDERAKKLTWDQLLDALEKNWEGNEVIRQMCLNAPKYGNGIEWVDAIGYRIQRTVMEYAHRHPRPHGQSANMRIIPITFHNPCGKVTMATPNGRPAGEYLSDGIVPSHGMDTKGPTVTLDSIARATCQIYKEHREDLLNMKISPDDAGRGGAPRSGVQHRRRRGDAHRRSRHRESAARRSATAGCKTSGR